MKKKTKSMLLMILVLVVLIVVYIVLQVRSKKAAENTDSGSDSYVVTDFDADSITGITYTYEGVTTRFLKENDQWVNEDDRTMELDQDKVANLITEVNHIYSEHQITEVEDLSQYGLNPAVVTVCMKSEGASYTILFGDYNDAIYQNYVALEGENIVYTTIKAKCSAFQDPISEFVAVEETQETISETTEVSVETEETGETAEIILETEEK